MKKSILIIFTTFILIILSNQRGFFIPEVALSGECSSQDYKSGPLRTQLIELYTSQGCSSCPPAEKWVNALYAHAGLYRDFIPMQFHVDYWDYIGWKDPYAKPQYSKRQRQYATEWSSGQVYTPAFVKNGKEWRTIIARRPPEKSTEKVGVLQALKKAKGSYQVRFEPSLQKFKGPLILHWALLGHGLATSVTRGENSGKALKNNFTVLSHRQKPLTRKQERFQAEVKIAPTAIKAPEYALVFWLTTGHSQAAIQATGGCINEVI